jgi:hypothetical protein
LLRIGLAGTKLHAKALEAASLESTMDRFDPNSHPDRFVFEAQARQIRAEEIDKASTPGCWVVDHEHALVQRLAQLGALAAAPLQPVASLF